MKIDILELLAHLKDEFFNGKVGGNIKFDELIAVYETTKIKDPKKALETLKVELKKWLEEVLEQYLDPKTDEVHTILMKYKIESLSPIALKLRMKVSKSKGGKYRPLNSAQEIIEEFDNLSNVVFTNTPQKSKWTNILNNI